MKRLLIFFTILMLASSCRRDEAPLGFQNGERMVVSLALSVGEDSLTKGDVHDPHPITKASDVIKNVWVIQFDGVEDNSRILGEPTYVENFGEEEGLLTADVSLIAIDRMCAIYFLANTFDRVAEEFPLNQGVTLKEVKGYRRVVAGDNDVLSYGTDGKYHPMFNGFITPQSIGDGKADLSVVLKRNVAKVNISVTNAKPEEVIIENVQICSVPSISYYFTTDQGFSAPFPPTRDFSKVNYSQHIWGVESNNNTLEFSSYLPLNLRGVATFDVPEGKDKSTYKNRYAPDGSTYLLVSGRYIEGEKSYPVSYTFYLGSDLDDDFNLEANRQYSYSFTISGKGNAKEDTRVTDWGLVEFTQENGYEYSNCYILNPMPKGGGMRSFRIPVDRVLEFWGDGNTAKYENDYILSLRNNGEWKCFVLASDFAISEDKFRIYKDKGKIGESPYSYFEVEVDSDVRGNVIIAVGPNEQDQYHVSWSWHLWITDYDPSKAHDLGPGKPQTYIYPVPGGAVHRYAGNYWSANQSVYIMDRNLGAFDTDSENYPQDNQKGLLYYQFGRKDPFFMKSTASIKYNGFNFSAKDYRDVNTGESEGVVYSVKNPLHFIKNDTIATRDANGNVVYKNGKIQYTALGYWTKNDGDYNISSIWNDKYASESRKSIFDPCPPGYRLPTKGIWSDFTSQGTGTKLYPNPTTNAYTDDNLVINADTPYSRGFKPYNQVKGLNYWPADVNVESVPEEVVYIPASGYLSNGGGSISANPPSASEFWSFLWSEEISSEGNGYGYTSQPNHLAPENKTQRARGLPVRCITISK